MKIYVLLKQGYDGNETICVSEDINKIRTSICEDFDANEDYPVFEVWRDGENIYQTSGSDVLKAISKEMYKSDDIRYTLSLMKLGIKATILNFDVIK